MNIAVETVCLRREEKDVIGQIGAEISAGNAKLWTMFILVKQGWCILGNVTARKLGVLQIGPYVTPSTDCNAFQDAIAGERKEKFPKVFQGIGKLRDFKLKLHVNPDVPHVAQKGETGAVCTA